MDQNNVNIYIIETLISKLILLNPPPLTDLLKDVLAPLIYIKIENGPIIQIPFLSKVSTTNHLKNHKQGYEYPPIEVEEALIKGEFKFNKGKSCLFTTNIPDMEFIKLQIQVLDGLKFPNSVMASSLVVERNFRSDLMEVQNILNDKIILYNNIDNKFCHIYLSVTLKSIGSHVASSSRKLKMPKGIEQDESGNGVNISDKTKKEISVDEKMNFLINKRTSNEEIVHEILDVNNKELKTQTTKSCKDTKPKGWLRSTPTYKGNIHKPLYHYHNTRTSFLRLYKIHPDMKKHIDNEVKNQLKEKGKILDTLYEEKIKQIKTKRRNNACLKTQILTKDSKEEIKVNIGLQTNPYQLEEKETATGLSLIENSYSLSTPTFEDEFKETFEDRSSSKSFKAHKYLHKDNETIFSPCPPENIANLYKSGTERSNYAINLNDSESEISENISTVSTTESERSEKNIQEVTPANRTNTQTISVNESELLHTTKSETKSSNESISKAKSDEPKIQRKGSSLNLIDTKNQNHQLVHQSSKTSSSVYPQSSEDKPKLKPDPIPPEIQEDMESTVSNLSEKIAKILKPTTINMPSIHTDSISSYIPSDFSQEYSCMSDI